MFYYIMKKRYKLYDCSTKKIKNKIAHWRIKNFFQIGTPWLMPVDHADIL